MSTPDGWLLIFAIIQALSLVGIALAAGLLYRRSKGLTHLAAAPRRELQRMASTTQHLGAYAAHSGRQLGDHARRLRQVLQRRWETVRRVMEEIRRPAREEVPAVTRTLREGVAQTRAWSGRLARLRRAAFAAAPPRRRE
ncbi:MAG: hypothetical protein HY320_06460 [Armatimonadetes bacterium]|nr:hypothetical protein [Armatimonadota bacterium]